MPEVRHNEPDIYYETQHGIFFSVHSILVHVFGDKFHCFLVNRLSVHYEFTCAGIQYFVWNEKFFHFRF